MKSIFAIFLFFSAAFDLTRKKRLVVFCLVYLDVFIPYGCQPKIASSFGSAFL